MTLRIGIALALSVALAAPAVAQGAKKTPVERSDTAPAADPPSTKAEPNPAPTAPAEANGAIGAAAGVPASVFVLRIAGTWEADGRKGLSRLVGVIEGGAQRFVVQWLSMPDGAVIQTRPLEDDEAAKLTFGDVRAETEDGAMSVFMDTEPDKDGMRDTWVLIVGDPGDIRFGPATN